MVPSNQGTHPAAKRRKVAESCKVCRTKKTRCDGLRPRCSPCMAKGVTCEYNEATVTVANSALSDLEARLQRLERQTIDNPQHNPRKAQLNIDARCVDPQADPPLADHPTTHFIRDITHIAAAQSNRHISPTSLKPDDGTWSVETDPSAMVVPKRVLADDLIDCYERFVYPLFPILHMPSFREAYESLWERQPQGQQYFESLAAEATFHATLNVVFALGCINSSQIEPPLKLKTSKGYYHRARFILPLDALDISTIAVVQYLLLTTNYLTFTHYSHRCGNTLAVAIRVAQRLRLNKIAESNSNNQFEREMIRRTWYHCLTLERLLSTLFGGETLLEHDTVIPLPAKIDDEYLLRDGTGYQPASTPSILDAFIITVKVFEIIEGARKINYGLLTRSLTFPELTEVVQLNDKIDQIEASLPFHLKCDNNVQPQTRRDQVLRLQAEAVMTRILHLRLILLRPNVLAAARQSLVTPASNPVPSSLGTGPQSALQVEVSSLCVRTAISAIDMLHANLRSSSRIFSSVAVFVTLSAATVIVASSLVSELGVTLKDGTGLYANAITKAFEVLDEHRWQVEGALRAKELLEKFLQTVNQWHTRTTGANQEMADLSRDGEVQVPFGIENSVDEFNLSDPLWTFQLDGSIPMVDITGTCLL